MQHLFLKPASALIARAAAMPTHATIGVCVKGADCRLQQAPSGTTG